MLEALAHEEKLTGSSRKPEAQGCTSQVQLQTPPDGAVRRPELLQKRLLCSDRTSASAHTVRTQKNLDQTVRSPELHQEHHRALEPSLTRTAVCPLPGDSSNRFQESNSPEEASPSTNEQVSSQVEQEPDGLLRALDSLRTRRSRFISGNSRESPQIHKEATDTHR
ncbi:hypothetical protein MJT46_008829 [Ovis ammon polii x Ovis aries]|nr:hypothetical protein MJT46_008829 [Ovis ammon polii x Ovis aries]